MKADEQNVYLNCKKRKQYKKRILDCKSKSGKAYSGFSIGFAFGVQ